MKKTAKSAARICLEILACIFLIILSVESGCSSGESTFKRGEAKRSFFCFTADYSTQCLVVRDQAGEVADSCREEGLEPDGTEKVFPIPRHRATLTMSRIGEEEIRVEVTFHGVRNIWRMILGSMSQA